MPGGRSSTSPAPRFPSSCSRASCSATSAARSPTRRQQKRGLFETADGGTIFLDEIGEMTPALQAKLLRFLEEQGVQARRRPHRRPRRRPRDRRDQSRPRGGGQATASSARTSSTGCTSCRSCCRRCANAAGTSRCSPSYYIDRFNREFKKRVRGLSPSATALLEQYRWPGNVRELRNAIERAMLLIDHDTLEPGDFTTLTRSITPTSSSYRPRA